MKSIRKVLFGTLLAGGAALAVAGGFSIADAQTTSTATTTPPGGQGGHWGHHRHGGMWHLYSQLGLTAEQKASIKSIFQAAKPQLQTLHQQAQANHLKLQQATPGGANYSATVAEVAQENATLASQRTTQSEEIRTQIYAVLTPTQKTQLATLQAQWAAKAAARQAARQSGAQ
jgi:Spy/CpxP family protein refolding chaperone